MKRLAMALVLCAPMIAKADGLVAWFAATGALISGLKITTMQQSATADKIASSKVQAAQAASSSAIDISNRDQVRKIWEDYGPSGQLVDPCYQINLADTSSQIKGRTDTSASSAASLVYSMSDDGKVAASGAAGLFGGTVQRSSSPYASSVAKRVERHQKKYCSVSEASLGYCTLVPNGMQAGDADFSLLYAPGQTYGWDQAETAADFVKTIAPVKPMPVATGCNTPACLDALRARRDEEPYLSMARFSYLRFVESRSTQATGDAKQAVIK